MGRDRVSMAIGDTRDGRFQAGVRERLDLAAVVTDEMVMVVASGMGRLEARNAVAEVDSLDEP